jgi:hypothetical protein
MLFGSTHMVICGALGPVVLRVGGGAFAHDLGDYFKSLVEWFH